VEIDPAEHETLAILRRNGVIGEPLPVNQPEITKVQAPQVVKRGPGRPRKADASNPAD
jgi:hypothetical protein